MIAERELRRRLEDRGRTRDLRRLDRLDGPPYRDHGEYVRFAKMLDTMGRLARAAIRSDLYTVGGLFRWLGGANRGSGPMWDETQGFTVIERLDAPRASRTRRYRSRPPERDIAEDRTTHQQDPWYCGPKHE